MVDECPRYESVHFTASDGKEKRIRRLRVITKWQLEDEDVQQGPTGSVPMGNINNPSSQALYQTQNEPNEDWESGNTQNNRTRKNSEPNFRQGGPAPIRGRGRGQPLRGGRPRANTGQISPRFTPVWARPPATGSPANKKPTGINQATGRLNHTPNTSPSKGAGRVSTESYQLPTTYGSLKNVSTGDNKASAFMEALENVKKTGVSIMPGRQHDTVVRISGANAQREAARDILNKFFSNYSVRGPSESKNKNFARVKSYFVDQETSLDRMEKQDDILRNLRQPLRSIKFPQTLLFLWPEDELPMKIHLGPNLEDLDPIRREFQYPVYEYDEVPGYIRIDGYDQEAMRMIVQRLRTKWAELMASVNVKAKLYLAQPPSIEAMRPEVDILKLSQRGGGFAYASTSLYGDLLGGAQRQQWTEKSREIKVKNDARLRGTVERCLQGLRFLRGHVRMRVNFGTFVLDAYRNPIGSKERHSFVEFRQMLLHDKTKGHLIPGLVSGKGDENLVAKCANATDLLEPFEATALSLDTVEPIYAVNFEFLGEKSTLLRLEVEFIRYPGSKQFEVAQRRWVVPQGAERQGDKRAALQVGVIDYERADWQLEIKALEFQKASAIDQSLDTFAHSVRFKTEAAEADQKVETGRKVTFSDDIPVARLIEKSAWRYRVKGTGYTFELSRYDEYRHVGIKVSEGRPVQTPPNLLSTVPVTSWGASIYDMYWDNVLGEHANYGVGRSANWRPNLNTFFPSREDPNPANVRAGFSEFLDMVTEISELLHPKQADSSQGKSAADKEVANGDKTDTEDHSAHMTDAGGKPQEKWADILIDSGAIF